MHRTVRRILTVSLCMIFLFTDVMSTGLTVQASGKSVLDSMIQEETGAEETNSVLPEDTESGNKTETEEMDSGQPEEESGAEDGTGETNSEQPEDTGNEEEDGTGEADPGQSGNTGSEEGTETGETDPEQPEDTDSGEETETEETDAEQPDDAEDQDIEETESEESESDDLESSEEETLDSITGEDNVMHKTAISDIPADSIRDKGTSNNISWVLDIYGKLVIEGTGDYEVILDADKDNTTTFGRSPWYNQREHIVSAEVNVTGMTNANGMFRGCMYLKSIDLSGFDGSGLVNTKAMFMSCPVTELDLSGFDTSNVTDMSYMFNSCSKLTGLDLSGFDTSNVTDMKYMFCSCKSLTSLDLRNFNTHNVTNMRGMFDYCEGLTNLDVSSFDTGNVTDMSNMFRDCDKLTSLDVSSFDTSKVTIMHMMFSSCESLESLDLSVFDTSNVTDMYCMFSFCSALTSVDVSSFDTGNVKDMLGMFSHCSSLKSLDLSNFDTGNVVRMASMFAECTSLTSLNVSSFNTGNVGNYFLLAANIKGSMEEMFSKCYSLTSLDVSSFDTRKVDNVDKMFYLCEGLTELDLSSFDLRNVESPNKFLAFRTNDNFKLYTPRNFMWNDCGLPGVDLNFREFIDSVKQEIKQEGKSYYDSDGNEYRTLPQSLPYSILLVQGEKPSVTEQYITAGKNKTAYTCGETLTILDLNIMYYGSDGTVQKLSEGYTTNVDSIDMSTPGEKELVVTYNKDGVQLTASVKLTVTWGLRVENTVITLPDDGCYTYDGSPKRPSPIIVYMAEEGSAGVILQEGTDYKVSYRNNVNAFSGSADGTDDAKAPAIIVKGMGEYSGTFTKTFTIEKAAAPANEEIVAYASKCTEARKGRKIDLSGAFAGYGAKTYVRKDVPVTTDQFFSTIPSEDDINAQGILTYDTVAGEEGASAAIIFQVSFANYQDALLTVSIIMTGKTNAVISGITMKNSVYDGSAVSCSGETVVTSEDGEDISGQVKLSLCYSGIQADGTSYPVNGTSEDAPVNAGKYTLTVAVEDSDERYMGSKVYPFTIEKAPLTISTRDVALLVGEPLPTSYEWDAEGLIGNEKLTVEPSFTFRDDKGNPLGQTELNTAEKHTYYIIPGGADAGMNYEISYKEGMLTVREERVEYNVSFDLSGHGREVKPITGVKAGSLIEEPEPPEDPAGKYFFIGWYKDRTFANDQKWDFMSDTVQSDLTLYACWIAKVAEGNDKGLKVCIQDIQYQTYTGSAVKPNVLVYDADGETLLKAGKDYTVKYVNNINAVSVDKAGKPDYTGGTAAVTDPGKRTEKRVNIEGSFRKDMPYIVFTGKGNYKETIYKNFIILPMDFSVRNEDGTTALAPGFTIKYAEQIVKNVSKEQIPFQALKYKKKMKLGTDFSVTMQATENVKCELETGSGNEANPSEWSAETIYNTKNRKYVAPAIPKGYSGTFLMTIKGTGNYTGNITRNIYVADQSGFLMKNAKITLGRNLKSVPYGNVRLTPGYYDTTDKKYYTIEDGNKREAEKENLFTVSVKNGNKTEYLKYDGMTEDNPYFITYRNHEAVGTATMVIEGNSKMGYFGSKSVTFKITGKNFNDKVINVKCTDANESSLQASMPYTGKAVTQNKVLLTTSGTKSELTYGEHYTISYKNNINKGTATMIFTAKPESGYSGSFKKTFKITSQSLRDVVIDDGNVTLVSEDSGSNTKNLTWQSGNVVYSKNGSTLDVHLKNEKGITLKLGKDYTVSYQNNKAVTTDDTTKMPLMIIKGKGNYDGSLMINFRIDKADIGTAIKSGELSISCASVMKKSNMKFSDFKFKITEGKKALKVGSDYTLDLSQCTDAIIQTYAQSMTAGESLPSVKEPKVTIKGLGCYTGEAEISLAEYIYAVKLTSKNLAIDIIGDKTYTGFNVEPEVSVAYYPDNNAGKNGAIADNSFNVKDYQITYGSNNRLAGKKGTITITGRGIYGGSVTVKFPIEKKAIY